ncbi:MAG TPA: hypothetical protein VFB15_00660 [Candidatus Binataceae bacterium]|jgi:hypothetical protein|nr:hypothetical protein [Candidatus Binataceae bacterium]
MLRNPFLWLFLLIMLLKVAIPKRRRRQEIRWFGDLDTLLSFSAVIIFAFAFGLFLFTIKGSATVGLW